jgi:Mg-chelatase subunit ChlD
MRRAVAVRIAALRAGAVAACLYAGAAALAAGALLALVPFGRPAPPRWVALVDTSQSVERRHPDAAARVRSALRRWLDEALAARAEVELWVVGPGAERRAGPLEPRALLERLAERRLLDPPAGGAAGTPVALALERIEAASSSAPAARLHWIGDASYTGTDPAALLARAAALGASCSAETLGPPLVSDVGFSACDFVEPLVPGAPVRVVGAVSAVLAAPGVRRVAVELEGSHGTRVEFELDVADGSVVPFRAELGRCPEVLVPSAASSAAPAAGPPSAPSAESAAELAAAAPALTRLSLRGRVRPVANSERDAFPENDVVAVEAAVGTAPRVACVGFDAATFVLPRRSAEAATAWHGAAEFPRGDAWGRIDVLLSRGAPSTPEAAAELRTWIHGGGVWWMLGAVGAAGVESWPDAALRDALPFVPARGGPERCVRLLVDASGSMQGEPFELLRGAALELVRRAPSGERIELCFFAAAPGPVHELRAARPADSGAVAAALRTWLDARSPSGATRLLDAVAAALDEPESKRAELLYVFSDGRDAAAAGVGAARAAELAELARQRRVELVPVACGPAAELALLGALSTSGNVEVASTAATLGNALVERALDGRAVVPLTAELHARLDGPLAARWWPAGWSRDSALPRRGRLARVEARRGAEVWLVGALADAPADAAAAQRVGAGVVAALAWEPEPGQAWPTAWLGEVVDGWVRERAPPRERLLYSGAALELRPLSAPSSGSWPAEVALRWEAVDRAAQGVAAAQGDDAAQGVVATLRWDPSREAWTAGLSATSFDDVDDCLWVARRAADGAAAPILGWYRQRWPVEARLPLRALSWSAGASAATGSAEWSAQADSVRPVGRAGRGARGQWPARLGWLGTALLAAAAALALQSTRAAKKVQVPRAS